MLEREEAYDFSGVKDIEQNAIQIARQLIATMRQNAKLREAVLLSARWFKLNFNDDTLNEHPPSKADLAGMFDAMQEALSTGHPDV